MLETVDQSLVPFFSKVFVERVCFSPLANHTGHHLVRLYIHTIHFRQLRIRQSLFYSYEMEALEEMHALAQNYPWTPK